MDKKVVAVLFGGASSEHEISKRSAATIITALDEEKYFTLPIYITEDGRWFLYDGGKDNIKNLQWEKFATPVVLSPDTSHHGILRLVGEKYKVMHVDVVFPVLHGKHGEDGTIQGLCELSGIPYVGSKVAASALCMDKDHTKMVVDTLKINQADYLVFGKKDLEMRMDDVTKDIRYKIGYPCFIKPAHTGSSVGISKAVNKKTLIAALNEAIKYDDKIIAEKMLTGRELEVAVLGNDAPEVSGVGEIVYEAEFYDYNAKYESSTSRTIVPADLPDDVSEKIRGKAVDIYLAAECKGLARCDFFWDEAANKVIFNEINTMPGFTSISMYPMLWQQKGVGISALVDKLIELAME